MAYVGLSLLPYFMVDLRLFDDRPLNAFHVPIEDYSAMTEGMDAPHPKYCQGEWYTTGIGYPRNSIHFQSYLRYER